MLIDHTSLYIFSIFSHSILLSSSFFFFFNDTPPTEIYTLSLHDALPISAAGSRSPRRACADTRVGDCRRKDRKSTRLNFSHSQISYAVFCLKKKKKKKKTI